MNNPSWLLNLLKSYVSWSIKRYCHKITVINKPRKTLHSAVFASTHQNTLLDPLVIITQLEKIPFSLTRGDVFKGVFKRLFYFFRMRPVFRIRDGFGQLRRFGNQSFSTLKELFAQQEDILFFPEADNQLNPALRPIKKGIIRVLKESDSKTKPTVYAVRISWDHPVYRKPKVLIEFSNPILYDTPEELPHKLELELKNLTYYSIDYEESRFSIFEKTTKLIGLSRDFTGLIRWLVTFIMLPIFALLTLVIYTLLTW